MIPPSHCGNNSALIPHSVLLLVALFLAVVTLGEGCAAGVASSDSTRAATLLAESCRKQQAELTSNAALLRVKMKHEGRIDDFRAEVFSQGDSLLSVYVRGFLGHSAFKAILAGDSLLVYFPSEHKYFSGLRSEIETGELRDADHIVEYLLFLLRGSVTLPDSAGWSSEVSYGGTRAKIVADDRARRCRMSVECAIDQEKHPYQKLESLELRSSTGKLHISVQVQSSHFNRQIPPEKFGVDLPSSTIQVSRDELVEMLTGVAP